MYRGSSGGEVALLIRRLFHRLGIDRNRVQFILTTASMPNNNDDDRNAVSTFANSLTACDEEHTFCYLTGEKEEIIADNCINIPISKFSNEQVDCFEGDDSDRLKAINDFFVDISDIEYPFTNLEDAFQWLYEHIIEYRSFNDLFKMCRGTAVS